MRYVELCFEAHLNQARQILPPFLGATLRGALGYVLRRTVCQNRLRDCSRCVLRTSCAYMAVFEGLAPDDRAAKRYEKPPQPFVLVVPGLHETEDNPYMLRWAVRLFGTACSYWPYVVHAYERIGTQGLGKHRINYELIRVVDAVSHEVIWPLEKASRQNPVEGSVLRVKQTVPEECTIRWVFHTPLRLVLHGRPLDGLALVLAGRRRFQVMHKFYGENGQAGLPSPGHHLESRQFTTLSRNFRPWELRRFSGRQKRHISLRGMLGEIVIHGPWGQAGAWLHAISLLHLGKATSFGFGRVSREIV